MLRSLRWRTGVGFLAILFATLTALGFVLASRVRHDAAQALQERLSIEARVVADAGAAVLTGAMVLDDLAEGVPEILAPDTAALVIAADGSPLYASPPVSPENVLRAPEVRAALAGRASQAVRPNPATGVSELHLAVPILRDGRTLGAVRVTGDRSALGNAVWGVAARLTIVGAIAAALGGAIVLWLTATVGGGLGKLAALARHLATGHLYERADLPPFAEADQLATAINDMATSLEQQVRSSYQERDTFGAVIESMADALLVVDDQESVALANPAAISLFVLDGHDFIGKRLMEVVRDHEIERIVAAAVEQGRHQTGHVEHGRDLRPLRVSVTPIQERGGLSALVLVQDLTDVQRLEAIRREFVANVSHELRTPLAAVKAAAEALEAGALDEPEAARDFLGRINAEVDHLTQLVQQLMDLSRMESGKARFTMEPVDVKAVLLEAVDRIRPQVERRGLSLDVNLPDGLPRTVADRAALHKVLLDLIDNASKFTEAGRIRVSAEENAGAVEVTVEDTGVGIAPEDLPHIFERFYKADRSRAGSGAGLGLALAKHTVQAHGGRIWAESPPGRGAVFHFTMPPADQAPGQARGGLSLVP